MTPVSGGTPAGDAYLSLRRLAAKGQESTDQLLSLYGLEGFLHRLSKSEFVQQFVVKGGCVLSAYGVRRPTRDIDLAGIRVSNDQLTLKEMFIHVLSTPIKEHDGLEYDIDGIKTSVIREGHLYSGVRLGTIARLATARINFHVDVNVGDPICPGPELLEIPRILGGAPLRVLGYSIYMVLAEKIATAVDRGRSNTRWRDYGDIWVLIHQHDLDFQVLQKSLKVVMEYRKVNLNVHSLDPIEFGSLGQPKWESWRRSGFTYLPYSFTEVSMIVWDFIDPLLEPNTENMRWDVSTLRWV